MPPYSGTPNSNVVAPTPGTALWRNESAWLWGTGNELLGQAIVFEKGLSALVPIASVPAVIMPGSDGGAPQAVAVEIEFDGVPGAFEIDIQDSDRDADAYFQNIVVGASIAKIIAVSANNTARYELNPFVAKFVRLVVKTLTNNVGLRAKVSRL